MKQTSLVRLVFCASILQIGATLARSGPDTAEADAKHSTGAGLLASRMGAALNSDLRSGGGTDDTIALQAVLNRAEHGAPVHLIIDGAALVSGLNVYGNSIIECINGGGLYLKDGSSRSIIRNVHRSRTAIRDEHITVRGCFLNGNRWNQPSASIMLPGMAEAVSSNKEADGTYLTGLQFLGVNDLHIENLTLWSIRAFGALIGNANRIDIRSVIIDDGAAPDDTRNYGNTDGLHFKGPIRYLTINDVKVRTEDDALAFNANDGGTDDLTVQNEFGPYVGQGPITDVTVDNVQFMGTVWGIRMLSSTERIDRVTINNVTGTINGAYVLNISPFMNPKSFGNFGSISISNVNVDRSNPGTVAAKVKGWAAIPGLTNELNNGTLPLISVNAQIESLSLQNVQTKVSDPRPILRLGPEAHVRMLSADLRLYDPELQSTPVELDATSRVDRLNLSILWHGATGDQGKQPIANLGGSIGQLNWVSTPPMYVGARFGEGKALAVIFSQDVKAANFQAGVTIKVNGLLVRASGVARPNEANVVKYILKGTVRARDVITWAYDAKQGSIQNLSGSHLLSVAEKQVATH